MLTQFSVISSLIIATTLTASAQQNQANKVPAPQNTAKAELQAKSGSKVTGTVDFTETPNGVKVSYQIAGLPKNSTFGFHIHETGDCSSPDGKSAGPHYLKTHPTGGTSKDFPEKYAGDLPQVKSDASGAAKGTFEVPKLTVTKDENVKIAGRSIILHGGPDDLKKKSAPRIACGEIQTAATTPAQPKPQGL